MSEGDFDETAERRNYEAPYTNHRQIPTIQKYREHKQVQETRQKEEEQEYRKENQEDTKGKALRSVDAVKSIFKGREIEHVDGDVYASENRHVTSSPGNEPERSDTSDDTQDRDGDSTRPSVPDKDKSYADRQRDAENNQSAAEANAQESDPRQKRKNMKHIKRHAGGREVTDPVTHLPITIRDFTDKDLKKTPENEPTIGKSPRTQTGLSGASKSQDQLDKETSEGQDSHMAMEKLFPPPNFEDTQKELIKTYQFALTAGLASVNILATLVLVTSQLLSLSKQDTSWSRVFLPVLGTVALSGAAGSAIIWGIRGWLGKKVEEIFEDEVWEGARAQEIEEVQTSSTAESTQWLNSLLASVWPLINPDLFTSLADMLEDVMQASLPKLIRMVSVDDLGQGSEAIRILGVRFLPTGAASQSVNPDGSLKKLKKNETNDRAVPGEGEVKQGVDDDKKEETHQNKNDQNEAKQEAQEQENMDEGMEAEQGDFVNMEIAFAYRARSFGKSLKTKAKNAHLYLKFYLPGSIALPVWVEMRGLVGTMRIRLQLTPDPPFFSLATITFLGQPKADLSCVPLNKHSLNIMDLPLISSFVQSSIDAALAEYVAPKSLTLDLKDMLMGDDFKKDTLHRGVIAVFVHSASDFKEGDGGLGPLKEGSSDAYVSIGWSKYGKPVASTRIILADQRPVWNEWAYVLVGPEELNAEERLQLQLWDSDRTTADDALGRIEVDLKDLMRKGSDMRGKMCDRKDRLMGEDADEQMPGTISWKVGYFAKTHITEEQLANQTEEPDVNNRQQLREKVTRTAENKMREATSRDESDEIDQQKAQDYKEREDTLTIASPPSSEHVSGIFSIQIHNITGLELERLNKNRSSKKDVGAKDDEEEEGDDLPSSYCTVILNHSKIFKTRTKPKNAKPFFNAGTERFIRDWRTSEIMVSVRDSRVHENDPLLGIIYLPLGKIFEKRCQVMESYPLVGGIGFGKARISMVFRSLHIQLPRNLLGWDYGTLEVTGVTVKAGLPEDLTKMRLKLRSSIMRAKMTTSDGQNSHGQWQPKHGKSSVFLAVRRRYSTPLVVEFRKSTLGPDSTPAFAIIWLSEIADEEEQTVTMKVWKGGKDALKRAEHCGDYAGMKDGETSLGEVEVKMKFWRGLSGYHKSAEGNDADIKDIMEVLDTANDHKEGDDDEVDRDTNSSSDSDSDASERHKNGMVGKVKGVVDGHNDSNDGSRGPLNQIKDYKDHHKQLHRQHRGIMQWKSARTVDWMSTKVDHGKNRIMDTFRHNEREPGVETEV